MWYLAGLLIPVYACWKLVQLARADADLALLSKGKYKPGAFEGKVVWVVGASQGLGQSLATKLSSLGARVILSSRRKDALEAVKSACSGTDSDSYVLPLDLCASDAELTSAVTSAVSAFDGAGLDYVFLVAGASQHALASETTGSVAGQLFGLNTLGPINLARMALPHMLERNKGRFVVISSMAAKVPSPGQAVYSGCKMALNGYFATLATEVADSGVGVTVCCPGPIAAPDNGPRTVYGPTGPVTREASQADRSKRLDLERCTELVLRAAAHQVPECWIAKHPVLALGYLTQYCPGLGRKILMKVGPKRARAVHSGQGGYTIR